MEILPVPDGPGLSITGQSLDLSSCSQERGACVSVDSYERLNRLGEGTYGVVWRAKDRGKSKIVALKQVRIPADERRDGIPITALRELSILRSLKHPNIINVLDVAVGSEAIEDCYMVMEYAEQDLATMLDELHVRFTLSQVKCLFRQLLDGLEYIHRSDIIHRDVKMQNILLTAKGVLKLADFGMARAYRPRPLTPGVVTIWYRAPEILLGTKYYTPSIDIWSAGLVLGELLLGSPSLPGETTTGQLAEIIKLVGSPTSADVAALSAMGCPDLIRWRKEGFVAGRADNIERKFLAQSTAETVTVLRGLLRWDPGMRWTAAEALGWGRSRFAAQAEQWWTESPRAVDRALLPTYPEIRNKSAQEKTSNREDEDSGGREGDYLFNFNEDVVVRPAKRRRG